MVIEVDSIVIGTTPPSAAGGWMQTIFISM
jgi:hypothetical protein